MTRASKYKLSDEEDYHGSNKKSRERWHYVLGIVFPIFLITAMLLNHQFREGTGMICQSIFIYNISSLDETFHARPGLTPEIAPYTRVQPMYTLSEIFYQKLQDHCLTTNPKEAKLFFIPFHFGIIAKCPSDIMEFLSKFPWMKRRDGRDHFLVSNKPAYFNFQNEIQPNFVRYWIRDESCGLDMDNLPFYKDMVKLVPEKFGWFSFYSDINESYFHNYHAIPYPSNIFGIPKDSLYNHTRKSFATFVGSRSKCD